MSPEEIKAKKAAYQKKWRQSQTPEKQAQMREQISEWHRKHPERLKELRSKHYEENKDRYIEQQRLRLERIRSNSDSNKDFIVQNRLRKRQLIRGISEEQWQELLEIFQYRCAYCRTAFSLLNKPEPDHIVPVTLGGPRNIYNIAPSCRSCNAKKQRKHVMIFIHELVGGLLEK